MNTCFNCSESKSLYNFQFRKDTNKYRNTCKLCRSNYHKQWKTDNKEHLLQKEKEYRIKNKERLSVYHKCWRDTNNETINSNRKLIYKQNMKNPEFRILNSCRSRVRNILSLKSDKTINLIGKSPNFLVKWLEYQFNSNMSWNNYGSYWHIEHVTPCSSFNLENKKEQYKCFNWENLKPLEASKNCSKGDKIVLKDILNQEIVVYYFKKQNQL